MTTRLPCMYMPPISAFAGLITGQRLQIDISEKYIKGSFRNTALIAGPNGIQSLIIPIVKHNNGMMGEVQISNDEDWRRIHLRSIETAYGTAPYFEYYINNIIEIYEDNHLYLWELNQALFNFVISKLQVQVNLEVINERSVDQNTNQSSIQPNFFNTKISQWKQIRLKPYPQVFEYKFGWQNDLSILDLLMCLGPTGKAYLQEQDIVLNE